MLDEEEFLGAEEMSPSGDRLRLWFGSAGSRTRVAARLRAAAESGSSGPPSSGAWERFPLRGLTVEPGACEPPRDWTAPYRRFFRGVRVGGFFVHPPGIRPDPALRSLLLTPGPAFGTGMHATTRMMLEALAEHLRDSGARGARILDVGTGSGILAVAAAMLGAGTIVGLDQDPAAIVAARETAAQATGARILLRQGDFRSSESAAALDVLAPAGFDLILANLSAGLLGDLWKFAAPRLRKAGRLIVSGFLRPEARTVLEAFPPAAVRIAEIRSELPPWPETDLWLAATLKRRSEPPRGRGGARPLPSLPS